MNWSIPTITLSEAEPLPHAQEITLQEDENYGARRVQDQQPHLNRRGNVLEQRLMDEITALFGPHLIEVAMKQDTLCQVSPSQDQGWRLGQEQGQASLTVGGTSVNRSSTGPMTTMVAAAAGDPSSCVATMLVPGNEPRVVDLSHGNGIFSSVRVAWLQELKIVYRCCGSVLSPTGGGQRKTKACFLDAMAFMSAVRPQLSSEDDGDGAVKEGEVVKVFDLSHCETLEVLWIEDHDSEGRPHRLRSWRNSAKGIVNDDDDGDDSEHLLQVPFAPHQGLHLPGRLKSLTMVGMSANRFNFGWLRSTPRLETLNIHGMRFLQVDDDSQTLPVSSLWDMKGVFLPQLEAFSIHHSPARQFRFEVLKHCPRLAFLDVRDLNLGIVRAAMVYPSSDQGASGVEGSVGGLGAEEGGGVESVFATKISTCRFEFLRQAQGSKTNASREDLADCSITGVEMVKLLECYFPRLRHLHLDGIPVSLSIEITTGPPEPTNQRQHQQPRSKKDHQTIFAFDSAISEEILEDATTTDAAMRAAELSCLERVLTRENESAQQVLEYRLVPLLNEKSQMESMVEQLGMTAHSVLYTIGRKNWLRIAS